MVYQCPVALKAVLFFLYFDYFGLFVVAAGDGSGGFVQYSYLFPFPLVSIVLEHLTNKLTHKAI